MPAVTSQQTIRRGRHRTGTTIRAGIVVVFLTSAVRGGTAAPVVQRSSHLNSNDLAHVAVDKNTLWFGTAQGAVEWTGGRFIAHPRFGLVRGVVNDGVFQAPPAPPGEERGTALAWVCHGEGVQRYDGTHWDHLTPDNSPLSTSNVNALAVDLDGSVWIGPSVAGAAVQRVVGSTWTSFTPDDSGLISTAVSAMAVDSTTGEKWFGDRFSAGLASYDDETWTTFLSDGAPFSCTAPNGVPGRPVTDIEVDAAGVKWIGSGCGLTRYDGVAFTTLTTTEGLSNNNVRDIAVDAAGNVWIATQRGINRYDGRSFMSWFTTQDARTVVVDGQGLVWASFQDVGVRVFDGNDWTLFTPNDGPLNPRVMQASAVNPNGDVWFGTDIGIAVATKVE